MNTPSTHLKLSKLTLNVVPPPLPSIPFHPLKVQGAISRSGSFASRAINRLDAAPQIGNVALKSAITGVVNINHQAEARETSAEAEGDKAETDAEKALAGKLSASMSKGKVAVVDKMYALTKKSPRFGSFSNVIAAAAATSFTAERLDTEAILNSARRGGIAITQYVHINRRGHLLSAYHSYLAGGSNWFRWRITPGFGYLSKIFDPTTYSGLLMPEDVTEWYNADTLLSPCPDAAAMRVVAGADGGTKGDKDGGSKRGGQDMSWAKRKHDVERELGVDVGLVDDADDTEDDEAAAAKKTNEKTGKRKTNASKDTGGAAASLLEESLWKQTGALARHRTRRHRHHHGLQHGSGLSLHRSFTNAVRLRTTRSITEGEEEKERKETKKREKKCTWNYSKIRCEPKDECDYRFQIGDTHLSESCRPFDGLWGSTEKVAQMNVPRTDSGCNYNWAKMRCEPMRYCSHQFRFGDFDPSTSCRILKEEKITDALYKAETDSILTTWVQDDAKPPPARLVDCGSREMIEIKEKYGKSTVNGAQRGVNYLCSTGLWEDGDALTKKCAGKVNAAGQLTASVVGHHCPTTPAKVCSAAGLGWDSSGIVKSATLVGVSPKEVIERRRWFKFDSTGVPIKARFTLPVHIRLRRYRQDEVGYVSMSVPLQLMRSGELSSGENDAKSIGTDVMDAKCKMCRWVLSAGYLAKAQTFSSGDMPEEEMRRQCQDVICGAIEAKQRTTCMEACFDMVRPGHSELHEALCDSEMRTFSSSTLEYFRKHHESKGKFLECRKWALKKKSFKVFGKEASISFKGLQRGFSSVAIEYRLAIEYEYGARKGKGYTNDACDQTHLGFCPVGFFEGGDGGETGDAAAAAAAAAASTSAKGAGTDGGSGNGEAKGKKSKKNNEDKDKDEALEERVKCKFSCKKNIPCPEISFFSNPFAATKSALGFDSKVCVDKCATPDVKVVCAIPTKACTAVGCMCASMACEAEGKIKCADAGDRHGDTCDGKPEVVGHGTRIPSA